MNFFKNIFNYELKKNLGIFFLDEYFFYNIVNYLFVVYWGFF